MRKKYLQKYRPKLFNRLVLSEDLNEHCAEIDAAARRRIEIMLPWLAEAARATEEMRARDLLKLVELMNTCKTQAEEVVFMELIYSVPEDVFKNSDRE